jgi:hypothetical protein
MSDEKPPSFQWGIAANVLQDKVLRTNAKVLVLTCRGGDVNALVSGLDKGGRMVTKFTKLKRLERFRPVWLTPKMREKVWGAWETKEEVKVIADTMNKHWGGVRFFDSTGQTLIRNGRSERQALKEQAECR